MDSQVRNFRDFLQLYNRLTEMCFQHCVDNFFSRELSADESTCLDRCVSKFSNVNQRVMGSYVTEQSIINERRMKEVDAQIQAHNLAAAAESATADDSLSSVTPTSDSATNQVAA